MWLQRNLEDANFLVLKFELSGWTEEHLQFLGQGRKGALEHVRARTPQEFAIDKLETLLPKVEAKPFDEVELKLKPGAIELLEELNRRATKRIIATSTNRDAVTKRFLIPRSKFTALEFSTRFLNFGRQLADGRMFEFPTHSFPICDNGRTPGFSMLPARNEAAQLNQYYRAKELLIDNFPN